MVNHMIRCCEGAKNAQFVRTAYEDDPLDDTGRKGLSVVQFLHLALAEFLPPRLESFLHKLEGGKSWLCLRDYPFCPLECRLWWRANLPNWRGRNRKKRVSDGAAERQSNMVGGHATKGIVHK